MTLGVRKRTRAPGHAALDTCFFRTVATCKTELCLVSRGTGSERASVCLVQVERRVTSAQSPDVRNTMVSIQRIALQW